MRRYAAALLAASILATGGANAQAPAAPDRTVLPVRQAPFAGEIPELAPAREPLPPMPVRAPQGAPNIFVMMSDDVGFGMSSAFGGPVPTPNMDRLAATGQRYNRFHTTGICSPSRAALLTGRNHHEAGMGFLSDIPNGYPGYAGTILPTTATFAQILRLNGYNTAMDGKHHDLPPFARGPAGPFDGWPTGLGFEHFFGFVNGDSDQYDPILYRGTELVSPDEGVTANGKREMLDQRLADDMIDWVHNQKAQAPNKPFLIYFSPGSTHAPHQAPPEYIARFKGKFDQGWDKMREETWKRQLKMGIIPKGTKLTPRPAEIPAWDSLTPGEKAFAARTMEVAAAQLAFQDDQLGRVIDELQRMGQLDNTLVAVIEGDNGASGEAGPPGTINELRSIGGQPEREAWLEANIDKLGGPDTYENYPVGWAWAMNAPLRWTKQFGSMLGGIRNGMILSWNGHVAHPGSICGAFSHLVDITPTLLDAAHVPMPRQVYGYDQKPLNGESLLPSLTQCDANKPRTQYFEITGKVGLYHDGWFLSGDDHRVPWKDNPPDNPAKMDWTLYDLTKDWSQSTDVSAQHPEKMKEMLALWQEEAKANNVFPLDHRMGAGRASTLALGGMQKHYDYWGKNISIVAAGPPFPIGRSFTLKADLVLDKAEASGVVTAIGSKFGGWSLYLDNGHPAFTWARSTDPQEIHSVVAQGELPQGNASLTLRFVTKGFGQPADVTLSSDGKDMAHLSLPSSFLMPSGNGETLDIGRDIGVPVTNYRTPFGRIDGDIPHISLDFD